MIVVADAAPLIFLAKINQLPLISRLFEAEIFIPAAVSKEVLGPDVAPDEERLLTNFLARCRILDLHEPTKFANALSYADNCILTLALEKQADMILSDDRLLRKTATIEGIQVTGTIGVLIRAVKLAHVTPAESLKLLDELVRDHNFRISTRVYEAARKIIDQFF